MSVFVKTKGNVTARTEISREYKVHRVGLNFDQIFDGIEVIEECFGYIFFVLTQFWYVAKRVVLRARDDFLIYNKG